MRNPGLFSGQPPSLAAAANCLRNRRRPERPANRAPLAVDHRASKRSDRVAIAMPAEQNAAIEAAVALLQVVLWGSAVRRAVGRLAAAPVVPNPQVGHRRA